MLSKWLRRFRRADSGIAALEFALVAPVMIVMLFGMGELSLAVFCRTDVNQIASTVADLVAQDSTIAATDLSNVYSAANTILYPYPNKPSIRITSVIYDTTAKSVTAGKVQWTCTQAGSGTLSPGSRAKGDTVTFSYNVLSSGGSVIMVETAYNYASTGAYVIPVSIPMSSTFYTTPRRVGQIPSPSPAPSGCST